MRHFEEENSRRLVSKIQENINKKTDCQQLVFSRRAFNPPTCLVALSSNTASDRTHSDLGNCVSQLGFFFAAEVRLFKLVLFLVGVGVGSLE